MTTSVLDRVPLDDIAAQAREAHPGRVLLTVIAGLLFGLGWVVAKVFAVAWLAAAWSFLAVREGWRSAHGPSRSQQMSRLLAEVERLRAENSRFSG